MVKYESGAPLLWELVDLPRHNLLHLFFLLFRRQLRVLLFLTRNNFKWVNAYNCKSVLHWTHHKLLDTNKSFRKLELTHKVWFPILLKLKAEECASPCPNKEILRSHRYTFKLHFFLREELLLQHLNRCNLIVNLHLGFCNRLRFSPQSVIFGSHIVTVNPQLCFVIVIGVLLNPVVLKGVEKDLVLVHKDVVARGD